MHGMICVIMKNNGLNVTIVEIRADLSVFFLIKESFFMVKLKKLKDCIGRRFNLI